MVIKTPNGNLVPFTSIKFIKVVNETSCILYLNTGEQVKMDKPADTVLEGIENYFPSIPATINEAAKDLVQTLSAAKGFLQKTKAEHKQLLQESSDIIDSARTLVDKNNNLLNQSEKRLKEFDKAIDSLREAVRDVL